MEHPNTAFPHRRIAVVGTTSSGKSTLAEKLAQKIGADFIELDALHWEPNWVEAQSLDFFVTGGKGNPSRGLGGGGKLSPCA